MLALTGAGLSVFTWINTLTREDTLGNANLNMEERWQIEGALQWWRDFGTHFSYPFGAILIIGGLTVALTTRLRSSSKIDENAPEEPRKPQKSIDTHSMTFNLGINLINTHDSSHNEIKPKR